MSTIKGYRAMIADTYRHLGRPDPGCDKHLSGLIANLERRRPVVRSLVPRWNLPWVLTWLNTERFEPLPRASLGDLTRKTCFLVALATAARVSELHALSVADGCFQKRQDGSIDLLPDPSFLAKNRLPSAAAQTIHLVPLKSAENAVQARLQDPVRALKIYRRRTKEARGDRTRLFLPIKEGKADISAQTISSWLRSVISSAYADLSPQAAKLLRIRAHEVRAVSTSLALQRNCAVQDIIQAVGWRSNSTFARFYMRDLSTQREELNMVGDIVAAQAALSGSAAEQP